MKRQNFKAVILFALAGLGINSCDLIKDISYEATPNPLEMHGDSVTVEIKATIPEKGLHKKAVAEITPVLKYEGGEKALKMVTYQGEKAAGNGITIPSTGKTVTYTDMIPYDPQLEVAELYIKVKATKGSKEVEVESEKVADATIITPLLVMPDDKILMADDKFVRITNHNTEATINYLVNSSVVRNPQLKEQDIMDLQTFLTDASTNEAIALKSMTIKAYASPEGEISKNENLANERAASAQKAVEKMMAKIGIASAEGFFNPMGVGEDWDGFKKLMEASSIEDKNLILRVLEMTTDPTQREQEIRNMSETYLELKKEILPELRRSQMVLNYDLVGKSDEELKAMSKSSPQDLNVEELLYAATLTADLNEKLSIYKACEQQFPQDWRGVNNVGCIYMEQNKIQDAKAQFEKANGIKDNPKSTNNLGAIARMEGDRAKAKELFKKAAAAGGAVTYNEGVIAIQEGDYAGAIAKMGGAKTFNMALAQLLNGNADNALNTINASEVAESPMALYLKAIIGARKNDSTMVADNLKAAIAKDASLKEKAQKDREFLKFADQVSAL